MVSAVTSATDLELAARNGDAAAFGRVLRAHDADLRGVVWSVLRDRHATDDVLQVAYEKAFRALGGFAGDSTMKTWLHSICVRAALDHLRYERRRRHQPLETLAADASSASTSDEALANLQLDEMLERLDPETRALLMLTVGLGYSYDETAEIVGMERGTVASRVARARERLRKEVAP